MECNSWFISFLSFCTFSRQPFAFSLLPFPFLLLPFPFSLLPFYFFISNRLTVPRFTVQPSNHSLINASTHFGLPAYLIRSFTQLPEKNVSFSCHFLSKSAHFRSLSVNFCTFLHIFARFFLTYLA